MYKLLDDQVRLDSLIEDFNDYINECRLAVSCKLFNKKIKFNKMMTFLELYLDM